MKGIADMGIWGYCYIPEALFLTLLNSLRQNLQNSLVPASTFLNSFIIMNEGLPSSSSNLTL